MKRGVIVVVDDEIWVRELFVTTLAARGHTVATAADVAEGLATCERMRADVAVVDIFMPERSGLELIRALRRQPRPPRILAITGGGSGENFDVLATAKDAGADLTLRKPLPVAVLVDAVEGLLEAP